MLGRRLRGKDTKARAVLAGVGAAALGLAVHVLMRKLNDMM